MPLRSVVRTDVAYACVEFRWWRRHVITLASTASREPYSSSLLRNASNAALSINQWRAIPSDRCAITTSEFSMRVTLSTLVGLTAPAATTAARFGLVVCLEYANSGVACHHRQHI